MKRAAVHLAVGLACLLPILGQAEMRASQMQLAKQALATQAVQLPDVEADCPSIEFPTQFRHLETGLDALREKVEDKKACVDKYLAATDNAVLRAFLDKRYPSATGSQISTLLTAWGATFEPRRQGMKDELAEAQEKLQTLSRPFKLLRESKRALARATDKCPEPASEEWTSVAAARKFQAQYQVYEGCLQEAKSTFMAVSPADLVEMSWSQESDFVQSILLLESGSMLSSLVASVRALQSKYTDRRWAAHHYIRANSKD